MESCRHKVADDFGPKNLTGFMDQMQARIETPGYRTWSIAADGELGGLVTFERVSPWLGTAQLFLKPGFHGQGLSLAALRVTFGEMFQLGVGKLAFAPAAGSQAFASLLVNLGARREGKLFGHTLIGGKPANVNLYGLLKDEFEKHAAENHTRIPVSAGSLIARVGMAQ
jgi:RimJ/RimL family protein N-acetyltransferase